MGGPEPGRICAGPLQAESGHLGGVRGGVCWAVLAQVDSKVRCEIRKSIDLILVIDFVVLYYYIHWYACKDTGFYNFSDGT